MEGAQPAIAAALADNAFLAELQVGTPRRSWMIVEWLLGLNQSESV